MSRIAKTPIIIPTNVNVNIDGKFVTVEGKNGKLSYCMHDHVKIKYVENMLIFSPRDNYTDGWTQAGTARSVLNSMIIGVMNEGFVKRLQLVGIGYRVTVKDNIVNLSLGFSHNIKHLLPSGITAECPSQTEIVLSGANKYVLGQVAADLRSYRRPEPYKGKGIRYVNEIIRTKVAKKK